MANKTHVRQAILVHALRLPTQGRSPPIRDQFDGPRLLRRRCQIRKNPLGNRPRHPRPPQRGIPLPCQRTLLRELRLRWPGQSIRFGHSTEKRQGQTHHRLFLEEEHTLRAHFHCKREPALPGHRWWHRLLPRLSIGRNEVARTSRRQLFRLTHYGWQGHICRIPRRQRRHFFSVRQIRSSRNIFSRRTHPQHTCRSERQPLLPNLFAPLSLTCKASKVAEFNSISAKHCR